VHFYRRLFRILTTVGRPVGGLKPRSVTNWVGRKAYQGTLPGAVPHQWVRDRRGDRFYLNPFFLIDRQVIAYGDYDAPLHRFIDRHIQPGMVCFDVGANIGLMSVHMARRVGPTGAVFSFEPVPTVHQRLEQHIQANQYEGRAHLHRVALSNADGKAEIHYGNEDWTNHGMASLVAKNHRNVQQTCMVETSTLESFVERHRVERIDFIKVDIEGAEPLFLEGAREVLRSMKPLLSIEVSAGGLSSLTDYGPRDLVKALEDLGYDLFEVGTNGDRGRRIDHNSIPEDYDAANLCGWPKSGAA